MVDASITDAGSYLGLAGNTRDLAGWYLRCGRVQISRTRLSFLLLLLCLLLITLSYSRCLPCLLIITPFLSPPPFLHFSKSCCLEINVLSTNLDFDQHDTGDRGGCIKRKKKKTEALPLLSPPPPPISP